MSSLILQMNYAHCVEEFSGETKVENAQVHEFKTCVFLTRPGLIRHYLRFTIPRKSSMLMKLKIFRQYSIGYSILGHYFQGLICSSKAPINLSLPEKGELRTLLLNQLKTCTKKSGTTSRNAWSTAGTAILVWQAHSRMTRGRRQNGRRSFITWRVHAKTSVTRNRIRVLMLLAYSLLLAWLLIPPRCRNLICPPTGATGKGRAPPAICFLSPRIFPVRSFAIFSAAPTIY
jgi:hypothetical protein